MFRITRLRSSATNETASELRFPGQAQRSRSRSVSYAARGEEEGAAIRGVGPPVAPCALPPSCALGGLGARVFAESLRRVVGRLCAKKIGQAERAAYTFLSRACPTQLAVILDVVLRNIVECNYRADVTGVERRAFRRFGRGACPETPHWFLW